MHTHTHRHTHTRTTSHCFSCGVSVCVRSHVFACIYVCAPVSACVGVPNSRFTRVRVCVCRQDSMGGSPNDIRISDMRPTLVDPPMYKPKVVLLGKDKKGGSSPRDVPRVYVCVCVTCRQVSNPKPRPPKPRPLNPAPFPSSESTDDSEADKMQCVNHSGSSATYSDYSPSQGSSGSSNPPPNTAMHTPGKDGGPQTHWTNRYTQTHTQAWTHTHSCAQT